jgi:hypothetical protein
LMIFVIGFWVDGLNVVIFVEFIVKVFAGQYKFVELEPREIYVRVALKRRFPNRRNVNK